MQEKFFTEEIKRGGGSFATYSKAKTVPPVRTNGPRQAAKKKPITFSVAYEEMNYCQWPHREPRGKKGGRATSGAPQQLCRRNN